MANRAALARRPWLVGLTLILALLALVVPAAPASAQTIVTVVNYPGQVRDNQCNGEPVALDGELRMVTSITPTANGGTRVRMTSVTRGLQGTGLVSNVSYRAVEIQHSVANYVPPPGTGTFQSVVATLLIAHGNAPNMLLVVVLEATLASDGTLSAEVERSYLVCAPWSAQTAAA
jgi:hypothetical protein